MGIRPPASTSPPPPPRRRNTPNDQDTERPAIKTLQSPGEGRGEIPPRPKPTAPRATHQAPPRGAAPPPRHPVRTFKLEGQGSEASPSANSLIAGFRRRRSGQNATVE